MDSSWLSRGESLRGWRKWKGLLDSYQFGNRFKREEREDDFSAAILGTNRQGHISPGYRCILPHFTLLFSPSYIPFSRV